MEWLLNKTIEAERKARVISERSIETMIVDTTLMEKEIVIVGRLLRQSCSAPRKLDRLEVDFSARFPWLGAERNRMKASKFTEAQKAFILKQDEQGTPVAEIGTAPSVPEAD